MSAWPGDVCWDKGRACNQLLGHYHLRASFDSETKNEWNLFQTGKSYVVSFLSFFFPLEIYLLVTSSSVMIKYFRSQITTNLYFINLILNIFECGILNTISKNMILYSYDFYRSLSYY